MALLASAATRETAADEEEEEWVGDDEAWAEEDEDEGEDELLGPRALPVDGEPDFESGPPADGLEYLRRVRWEAAQCPSVTRAEIDPRLFDSKRTSYAPRPPDLAPAPPGTEASKAWVEAFQPEFASLRASLRREVERAQADASAPQAALPPFRDGAAWEVYCLGSRSGRMRAGTPDEDADAADADPRADAGDGPQHGNPPTLGVLAAMDEVEAATMLHRAIDWLEHAPSLSRQHSLWLFALLARVDMPLDADTGAAVRQLCRRLCALRAAGSADATQHDAAAMLSRLNLLLATAGEFFGAARGAAYT